MRVIVTRPRAQAAEWVHGLQAHGIDAAALPLIDIAGAPDPAAVAVAWSTLGTHRLVVFVSPNAVQAFFDQAPARARWPARVRAASPGPGTTDALVQRGVASVQIVAPANDAPQFDSESLWTALAADDWRGASVLIVRGTSGRDWLAQRFIEHGARVDHVTAYARVAPTFDAVERGVFDAALATPGDHLWLLSSSEAIDHLEALVDARRQGVSSTWGAARAIATHPRIAARAGRLGIGRVLACAPTLDAVVACIQSIRS